MKKLQLLFLLVSVFCFAGLTLAAPLTYHDQAAENKWVDSSGSTPAYWVQLNFPDSTTRGDYSNGVFEYDGYVNQVDFFKITLHGKDDNSGSPIDIFLDFDANHNSYLGPIASYNVGLYSSFTLTSDIKNNQLLYNGVVVGSLSNIGLSNFVGQDGFWVGYACHFTHTMTEVDVAVNPVPEPSTLLLLGSGLTGLWSFRRKFKPVLK